MQKILFSLIPLGMGFYYRQWFLMILLALPFAFSAAAKTPEKAYTAFAVGDTVYYDADYGFVKPDKAEMCGIVRRIDEQDSITTIQVFDKSCTTLVAVLGRVASGSDFNRREDKQLYFRPDGTVEHMEVYYPRLWCWLISSSRK